MYQYAYRIRDRYNRSIVALAIITDANRQHHYSEYREEFWGTETLYRYRTFIILDHEPQTFRHSGNLFGLAMEVARRELALDKKDDEQRFNIKVKLVRHLLRLKVGRKKIRNLLNFIKFYIPFAKNDYFHKFEEDIQKLTKSRQAMGIEEAILEEFKRQGLREGREEGREESIRMVISRAREIGLPIEDIARMVALSIENVKSIIKELMEDEE